MTQVALHVDGRAQRTEILRLQRLEDLRVDVQLFRGLQDCQSFLFPAGTQSRTDAAKGLIAAGLRTHGNQPGLRSSSVSRRA